MTNAEKSKRWRERHPEANKAAQERWRATHPRAEYMAAYYQANRDRILEYSRTWRAANKKRIRLRRYHLTVERYDAMVAAQGGRCAICRRIPSYELVPDHDHGCCPGERSCGACIRGLLCIGCNAGLAYLGDTLARVAAALRYLDEAHNRRRAA